MEGFPDDFTYDALVAPINATRAEEESARQITLENMFRKGIYHAIQEAVAMDRRSVVLPEVCGLRGDGTKKVLMEVEARFPGKLCYGNEICGFKRFDAENATLQHDFKLYLK
jgi:hypothetical protein